MVYTLLQCEREQKNTSQTEQKIVFAVHESNFLNE